MSDLASLFIRVDSSGVVTATRNLEDFNQTAKKTERATESAAKSFDKTKASLVGVSVAISAVTVAVTTAISIMLHAAREEQVSTAFRNMSRSIGEDADSIIKAMKKASAGTIAETALMQKAIKGMTQDLNGKDLIKIAEIARITARATGQDITALFDIITDAIGSQTPRALRRLGLVSKEELKLLEDGLRAGVEGATLLDLVFLQAAISGEAMGVAAKNTNEEYQALKVIGEDMWDAFTVGAVKYGRELLKLGQGDISYMGLSPGGMGQGRQSDPKATDRTATLKAEKKGLLDQYRELIKLKEAEAGRASASRSRRDAESKAIKEREDAQKRKLQADADAFETGMQNEESWARIKAEYDKDREDAQQRKMEKDAAAFELGMRYEDEYARYLKEIADAEQAAAESKLQAYRNMYEDMKDDTSEYFNFRLEMLEREKAAYEAQKVDQSLIDKWYYNQKQKLETESTVAYINSIGKAASTTASALEQISQMHAEGSKEREKYHKMAMAFETAEKVAALATAVVYAVKAVANAAANSKTWVEALVAIAAVGGALAAVFASAGVSFGGGSSHTPAKPKSTVLGAEDGTASESIPKSYELLKETYDMEYDKLTNIYRELKSLNQNIMGLVTNIIRKGQGLPEVWTGKTLGTMSAGFKKFDEMFATAGLGHDSPFGKNIQFMNKFDPVSNIFREVTKYVTEKLFGGSSKTTQLAGGLGLNAISAGSLVGGGSVSGYTYADMYKKTDGGWLGKDKKKYWTQYAGMDESTTDLFTQVYRGISKTLVELSKGLGTDLNAAMSYVFGAVKINLMGKSSEEINKILQEHFSAVGDNAVEALFGSILKGYQKVGEGLLETAVRLMIDKEIIVSSLEQTNQSFSGTTAQLIAFSESLIDMAGDLEAFTDAVSTYYDKFFSDEEKQERLKGILTGAMAGMYKALPLFRDGYRSLVEGLDLTTESGQAAYATLLKLSGYADKYYSTLEGLAEKASSALKDALDEVSSAIDKQINMAAAAAQEARSAADAYRNIIETLTDAQDKIRGTGGSASKVDSVFALAMTGDQAALRELPGAIDNLLATSLKTSESAEDYARDQGKALLQLEAAKTVSVAMINWEEYQATLFETQIGVLEQIKAELEKPDPNMEILTRQAVLLGDITSLLGTGNTTALTGNATSDAIKNISSLNTSYSEEMLTALVTSESNQTTSLQNIVTQTSLTVAAIQQLVQLTATDLAAKEAAAAQAEADRLAMIAKEAADRQAAEYAALVASTTAAYNAQKSAAESYRSQWDAFATARASSAFTERQENITTGTAYSVTGYYSYSDAERAWLSQVVAAYQTSFASAYNLWKAIPGHALGLDYVPKDDYLMKAHKGEAVLTPTQASEWRNSKVGGDQGREQTEALMRIETRLKNLETISFQTAKNTGKSAKILDHTLSKWDDDGIPAERT